MRSRTPRRIEKALAKYSEAEDTTPLIEQILLHVPGSMSGRYYDGLIQQSDGTYTGVDVSGAGLPPSLTQMAFDGLVSADNPAVGATAKGTPISVTSVELVTLEGS